jgi:exodeoxyribonuclease VII large subunit
METLSVYELLTQMTQVVHRAMPGYVWVRGEVQRVRGQERKQIVRFDLCEQHRGHPLTLPCVIWPQDRQAIGRTLREAGVALRVGQQMLFRGRVALYQGRVQLQVRDVCPEFTLGDAAMRRQADRHRLESEGLLARNRQRTFPNLPLRVALLTSAGGEALNDFVAPLQRSGYGFEVRHLEIPVQGATYRPVTDQIHHAGRLAMQGEVDVVCLVRGGGSSADFALWDSYSVCRAVAHVCVPVVTGIGHERDRPLVQEVAAYGLATPTAAGSFLAEQVGQADATIQEWKRQLPLLVQHRLEVERGKLIQQRATLAGHSRIALSRQREQLVVARERVRAYSLQKLRQASDRLQHWREQLPAMVEAGCTKQKQQLAQARNRLDAVDPLRLLARGYSITTSSDGRVLRCPTEVKPGEQVITRLAEGVLHSIAKYEHMQDC